MLVSRDLGVLWRHRSAVERDRPTVLMKHGAKSRAGGVKVDDEGGIKVQQLQGWAERECLLEGDESLLRSTGPAVVPDKFSVIPGEVEEAP